MKTIDVETFIKELGTAVERGKPKDEALQNPDVAIWWRGVTSAVVIVQTAAMAAAKESS